MTHVFMHKDEVTGAGQVQQTTYVYTSRSLAKPNPCRGTARPAPAAGE